jgi:nicotinate-nucleotide pyrophosphorylase (carboxylating)
MNYLNLDEFIQKSLIEDIGSGDITTQTVVAKGTLSSARLLAKEDGVLCGLYVFTRVFTILDERIKVIPLVKDGTFVCKGCVCATVEGPSRSMLSAERTAINLLQHLSGIATRTRAAVKAVEGTRARITDTRKTTPLMRELEKYAVSAGGGVNHRFNLSDGILIKDNHIAAAGGITQAVKAARAGAPHTLKIEVEVENFEMVQEALDAGVEIIMLDNMSIPDMAEAVKMIGGRALVEASGNMGDKDLKEVADTGVDLISIGALTHTVRAMDLSLRFNE